MGYREMGRVRVQQILGLTWRYSYAPLNKVEARA